MIRIIHGDVGRLVRVRIEERLHDGRWQWASEFFLSHAGWNLLLSLLKPSLSLELIEETYAL